MKLVLVLLGALSVVRAGLDESDNYEEGDSKKDYKCFGPWMNTRNANLQFPESEDGPVTVVDNEVSYQGRLRFIEVVAKDDQQVIGKKLTFHFAQATDSNYHTHFFVYNKVTVEIGSTGYNQIDVNNHNIGLLDRTFTIMEYEGKDECPVPYQYHHNRAISMNMKDMGGNYVRFTQVRTGKWFAYRICLQLRELPTTSPTTSSTTSSTSIATTQPTVPNGTPDPLTSEGCFGPDPADAAGTNVYEGASSSSKIQIEFISLTGNTELRRGLLNGWEFYAFSLKPFSLKLYRPRNSDSDTRFEVVHVWYINPTQLQYNYVDASVDDSAIWVADHDRIGFHYEGSSPAPLVFHHVQNSDQVLAGRESDQVNTKAGDVIDWSSEPSSNKAFRFRACLTLIPDKDDGTDDNDAGNIEVPGDQCQVYCSAQAGPPGPPGPVGPVGPPGSSGRRKREIIDNEEEPLVMRDGHHHRHHWNWTPTLKLVLPWNMILSVLLGLVVIFGTRVLLRLKHQIKELQEVTERNSTLSFDVPAKQNGSLNTYLVKA